jgi:hypothetical protein
MNLYHGETVKLRYRELFRMETTVVDMRTRHICTHGGEAGASACILYGGCTYLMGQVRQTFT